MAIRFDGHRALVTGAGQGIGYGIAKALVAAGAETYALSRTQENLDRLQAEVPAVHTICVDVSDWDHCRAAVEKVIKDAGPMHLLVNNAGICTARDAFMDCHPQDLDRMMNVNLKAVINISQVVSKALLEGKSPGCIVNVSSDVILKAVEGLTCYSATKAALDQVTRNMALELAPHKIRVNAVNPTLVRTAMVRPVLEDPDREASFISGTPLGRIAEVDDVVGPVLFLLSNMADMITGTSLPVDGGRLLQ